MSKDCTLAATTLNIWTSALHCGATEKILLFVPGFKFFNGLSFGKQLDYLAKFRKPKEVFYSARTEFSLEYSVIHIFATPDFYNYCIIIP